MSIFQKVDTFFQIESDSDSDYIFSCKQFAKTFAEEFCIRNPN